MNYSAIIRPQRFVEIISYPCLKLHRQNHIKILLLFVSLTLLFSCVGNGKSVRSGLSRIVAPATLAVARNQYAEAYFDIPTSRNWVALTINDAPYSSSTPEILQLLAASPGEPHATFFVVGEHGVENPELLQAIKNGNHDLANHGFTNSPSSEMSLTEFVVNVEKTHSVLSDYWNEEDTKWFRPGDASFTKQQAAYLQNVRDYEIALGNAYPFDYADNNVAAAVRHIKRFVSPGAIIILHDGPEQGIRTVQILEQILPWLQEKGYSVKSLSELLADSGGF